MKHRKQVDIQKKRLRKDRELKKLLDKFSEVELFLFIDGLGGFVWRMEHSLTHGMITSKEWDEKEKFECQARMELAVERVEAFGLLPFSSKFCDPSREYWAWYNWWKKYISELDDSRWKELEGLIEDGKATGDFRPAGSWQALLEKKEEAGETVTVDSSHPS